MPALRHNLSARRNSSGCCTGRPVAVEKEEDEVADAGPEVVSLEEADDDNDDGKVAAEVPDDVDVDVDLDDDDDDDDDDDNDDNTFLADDDDDSDDVTGLIDGEIQKDDES